MGHGAIGADGVQVADVGDPTPVEDREAALHQDTWELSDTAEFGTPDKLSELVQNTNIDRLKELAADMGAHAAAFLTRAGQSLASDSYGSSFRKVAEAFDRDDSIAVLYQSAAERLAKDHPLDSDKANVVSGLDGKVHDAVYDFFKQNTYCSKETLFRYLAEGPSSGRELARLVDDHTSSKHGFMNLEHAVLKFGSCKEIADFAVAMGRRAESSAEWVVPGWVGPDREAAAAVGAWNALLTGNQCTPEEGATRFIDVTLSLEGQFHTVMAGATQQWLTHGRDGWKSAPELWPSREKAMDVYSEVSEMRADAVTSSRIRDDFPLILRDQASPPTNLYDLSYNDIERLKNLSFGVAMHSARIGMQQSAPEHLQPNELVLQRNGGK